MALQVAAVLVLGLMCGSELNVAACSLPTLSRQSLTVHTTVRSSFARLFGRVMPFWKAGSTLLNLLLLLPFEHLDGDARCLAAAALAIQISAVVFSLAPAIPINSRIATWTPTALPIDWQTQERRWDTYHWIRTWGLIAVFAVLAIGMRV